MSRGDDYSRTVYSSEHGRTCPDCGRPVAECICKKKRAEAAPTTDGVVRVRLEKKGRGGKTVTTINGVPLPETGLKDLAGELKRKCGTGGSVKDGIIEIQGDHAEALVAELKRRGFTAKRAGG